jgi:Flp pilus assembly protein TadB
MIKSIYLSIILMLCTVGFLLAGTTPGQESSLKRNFRKSTGTISTVEVAASPDAGPSAGVKASTDSKIVNSNSTTSGNNLQSLAHKSNVTKSKGKLFNGQGLGKFSFKNLWQAGKAMKSYKQSGFLQISITIFLFVVILLLIGMLLGVILNDLFIIFYIATALLLIWVLFFMLGNLGIKKR